MNLNSLSITEALEGLKQKKFSSVELTEACFLQIEKHDKDINAFITTVKKEAQEQATKADEKIKNADKSPLLGIPVALKDVYSTKGIKTTAGSKVLENYIPPFDATVVKKLKDAGAVIIGKTNQDAWAHGSSGENSAFGSTKNPYNKDYVSGGSSSGSAAAVSADMALAATGTDTGGSIRLPASFTNTVGLKPTYGRVSRNGIIAMSSSMDSIGHFTKTVEDSALMLQVTAGNDPMDATTPEKDVPDYTKNIKKGIKDMKIGIVAQYSYMGIANELSDLMSQVSEKLKSLGATVNNVSLPNTQHAVPCYYIIQTSEVSSNLARYDGIRYGMDRSAFGDEAKRRIMLGTFTLSAGYYDEYYKKAMRVRTLIKKDFDETWEKYDAIISLVSPTPPWKLGEKINDPVKMYMSDVLTVTANLAGIPGLSVPAGFVNGLPVGIQILGPHFSEDKLFQIGHAYEQETQFYKQKPLLGGGA